MAQTKIIQQLCDLVEDKKLFDNEEYAKRNDEVSKWYELLDKYLKENKKLNQIFNQYDMADGLREAAVQDIYYREGFLCGARLMLEIFGDGEIRE